MTVGKSESQMSVDNFALVGKPLYHSRGLQGQRALEMPAGKGVNAVQSSNPMA